MTSTNPLGTILMGNTTSTISTAPNYDSVYSPGNYLERNDLEAMYNGLGHVYSPCDPVWPDFGDEMFSMWNSTELKYLVNEYELDLVQGECEWTVFGDRINEYQYLADYSVTKCHADALQDYVKQKELEELQRDNVHALGLMQYLDYYGVDFSECLQYALKEMKFDLTYQCLADHAANVQMTIDVYGGKEWLLEKQERPKKQKGKKGWSLWKLRTLPLLLVNVFDVVLFFLFG